MKLEHDKKADAIYIHLSNVRYDHGKDLGFARRVDYDAKGEPRGIELLCVSEGVDTKGLPNREDVGRLLRENGIKVLG